MKINVTKSSMPPFDEYLEEIRDLWDTHWLTNMGVKHETLEKNLEKYLDVSHIILYTNGHLALESIWEVLNFPKGSEVITTPFTFCSTIHSFARKGLIPIFCDIDFDTYCIDTSKIEKLITKKTVAICPVHVYGNMCDVDKIEQIAKKYNLKVIYDAAHAFGVKYNGLSSANFGDFSMFSFHATKVYNTIEGGAVCFNGRDDLVALFNDLKDFGIFNQESASCIGGNAKMNEFQAAMGICNLRHLEEEIAKRKKVADRYVKNLGHIEGIKLCKPQVGVDSNYAYFPVVFDGFKKNRDQIFTELKQEGIVARKYFYPLVNEMTCYKDYTTANVDKTPVAKYIADRVLTLPMYSDLEMKDVDFICDIIKK